MPKFVSLLIDRTHQRYLAVGLWVFALTVVLFAGSVLWGQFINQTMSIEALRMLEPQARVRQSVSSTMVELKARLTAPPCSPVYHEQLRQIAFLPDGLNEFLYAPGGVARCSVNADFPPYELGAPDVHDTINGTMIWYDHPLDFMGQAPLAGSIILIGDIGIVVSEPPPVPVVNNWVHFEQVDLSSAGGTWHRRGETGIYAAARKAGPLAAYLPLPDGAYYSVSCIDGSLTCVATTAAVADVIAANWQAIAIGIVLGGLLALGISTQLHALLRHYWGFEARFRRHFKPRNIICTYQPILSLATGRISGCEVLVRWRDVDGSTVFPDQLLPIVEKHGLGRRLTEFVVDRAFEELSAQVPPGYRLQVNFNIFPHDLDAIWVRETLRPFAGLEQRFNPVVEIVESDAIQIEHAQREIEALRRAGIRTHLDDFGTGYSNIENLARLPVDGVKLDRSFAMAPDGSLMARMLANAIDMIHAAGHRLTIEGVETEARLDMLRATGQVDFVQGYLISRPVNIDSFVLLLAEQSVPTPMRPRLIA